MWSWNTAFEKQLPWRLVGEVAYIGTRQINQLGEREQNWAPIGGGSNGRQMVQKFGRTAETILVAPIGNYHYNALQTRLSRRFTNGFSFNVNYTLSRSEGLAGASNSDQQPRVRIPDLYHLNHSVSDFDRTHVFNARSIAELPFGNGPPVAEQRRACGQRFVGGWQLNNILSLRSGTPFTVTTSTTPLNAAGSINAESGRPREG